MDSKTIEDGHDNGDSIPRYSSNSKVDQIQAGALLPGTNKGKQLDTLHLKIKKIYVKRLLMVNQSTVVKSWRFKLRHLKI